MNLFKAIGRMFTLPGWLRKRLAPLAPVAQNVAEGIADNAIEHNVKDPSAQQLLEAQAQAEISKDIKP